MKQFSVKPFCEKRHRIFLNISVRPMTVAKLKKYDIEETAVRYPPLISTHVNHGNFTVRDANRVAVNKISIIMLFIVDFTAFFRVNT